MAQAIITRRKGKGVNKDLPEQITAFTAVADNTPQITLSWENPTEYWAGTLVVKKAGSAPEGVNDGEKIYNGTGTTYTDTAVEYDTEYFYRAFPYNAKKQYQTEVLTVSAMAKNVLIASELSVGSLIRVPVLADFQSRFGEYINWKIADISHDGYPDNSITLITDRIIQLMCIDAKEPNNTSTQRKNYGNSRWIYSNIRQWLNSNAAAGEWYSAQHSYDEPPIIDNISNNQNEYNSWVGFLNILPTKFIEQLLDTTHSVGLSSREGGGSESCTDKIFLATCTEVNLTGSTTCGSKLSLFDDDSSRLSYPTAAAVNSSEYIDESLTSTKPWRWWLADALTGKIGTTSTLNDARVYSVLEDGTLGTVYNAFGSSIGIRPLTNISSNSLISATPNADGSYNLLV